jgi:cyclopropane fatty-acyl-phospholipid synthase-like methyltransferase
MDMKRDATTMPAAEEVKACCATVYQSDWARLLLGDSFHPGGLELTDHLGTLLDLGQGRSVLDVASGQGASAIRLRLSGYFGKTREYTNLIHHPLYSHGQ